MQTFTPISENVAEIPVTGQIHRYIQRITADLTLDKMHTGVALVDKYF